MTYPIQKSEAEWQALLAEKGAEPGAFQVTRHAATERPFSGKYERVWADGSYHCICCGARLFDAGTKVPDDLSKVNIAFMTANGVASVAFAVFVISDLIVL